MPLTKSAKKALKVDRQKKSVNDLTRAKVKSALKGARLAIDNTSTDVKEKIDAAYRELDLAAKKNVIHKNRASRLKSRLAKKLAKSGAETKPENKAIKSEEKAEKVKKPTKAPVKKTTAKKK
jgi:small subunit ribosomal protein S20